jgi:hypothetical protein
MALDNVGDDAEVSAPSSTTEASCRSAVCPDYLALTDEVMVMPSLSELQRQCLASIVAVFCPASAFGEKVLRALSSSAFGFKEEDEVQVFLPLLGEDVNPMPFLLDMELGDLVDRCVKHRACGISCKRAAINDNQIGAKLNLSDSRTDVGAESYLLFYITRLSHFHTVTPGSEFFSES